MGQVIGKRGSRNRSYSFSEKDKKPADVSEPVVSSGTATLPASVKKEKKKRSVSSAAKFSSFFSHKKVSVYTFFIFINSHAQFYCGHTP